MTYRIAIVPASAEHARQWENFVNSVQPDHADAVWDKLRLYRAKNVFASPFIEFDTEADAIMFILKWS